MAAFSSVQSIRFLVEILNCNLRAMGGMIHFFYKLLDFYKIINILKRGPKRDGRLCRFSLQGVGGFYMV
jgi:hypothetical protein